MFGLDLSTGAGNATDDCEDCCSFVPLVASAGDHCPDAAFTCKHAKSIPSGCEIGCFHAQLRQLVMDNPGFFWTLGKFRWFEVLLLAAFGVLVRRLLDLSLTYARQRRGRFWAANEVPVVWDPREAARTIIYLAFTPPLALAVVWALTATDLLGEDAISLGDTTSHGIIVIAFLLGLFPNVAYEFLNRVVQGVFGAAGSAESGGRPLRGPGTEQPREPSPGNVPGTGRASRPGNDDAAGPPSFESLRIRVRQLLTGPLR